MDEPIKQALQQVLLKNQAFIAECEVDNYRVSLERKENGEKTVSFYQTNVPSPSEEIELCQWVSAKDALIIEQRVLAPNLPQIRKVINSLEEFGYFPKQLIVYNRGTWSEVLEIAHIAKDLKLAAVIYNPEVRAFRAAN